ncbi:hypothetical protein OG542_27540 [Streptomyces violaceus]
MSGVATRFLRLDDHSRLAYNEVHADEESERRDAFPDWLHT